MLAARRASNEDPPGLSGVPSLIRLPRRKRSRIAISALYRMYRVGRRAVPKRFLARRLLVASWFLDRIAFEQVSYWRGAGAQEVVRPQTIRLVREEVQETPRVLDLGGGSGA